MSVLVIQMYKFKLRHIDIDQLKLTKQTERRQKNDREHNNSNDNRRKFLTAAISKTKFVPKPASIYFCEVHDPTTLN